MNGRPQHNGKGIQPVYNRLPVLSLEPNINDKSSADK